MTEKSGKSKASRGGAKAGADPAKSVLGNLSSTRPTRMSRRRDGESATATAEPPEATTAAKAKAAAKATATPKAKATNGRKTATSKAAGGPKAAPKPKAAAKPRAVRSGSPSLERPAKTEPPKPPQSGPPSGAELVTTAVQAAGELAEIGVKMGARAVKRAVDRLPKP